MPKIRPATPPPAHVAVSVEPARPAKNLLVRKDDAWRSVQAPTDLDDEISDAKLRCARLEPCHPMVKPKGTLFRVSYSNRV